MAKKTGRNTRGRIISAAWKLFYQQGYDNTTVEEIIAESGTSKGSFYHYFEGKDALLSSLSYLFDEKYEQLVAEMEPEMKRHIARWKNIGSYDKWVSNVNALQHWMEQRPQYALDNLRSYFKLSQSYIDELVEKYTP